MPFKAKIMDKTYISIDLSNNEWNELKKIASSNRESIKLFCCDNLPYLRISKMGTKHFVHKTKNNCNWKPESPNHLKSKEIIFKACKEEGWKVEPEFYYNDWIADIFTTDGDKKIAFEVQWSRQTDEETIRRQQKYRKDGIIGIWFFRYIPETLIRNKEIPAFKLIKKENNYFIAVNSNEIELGSAVKHFLRGNIEFKEKLTEKRTQNVNIYKFNMECWKCKKATPVIAVNSFYISQCNCELYSMRLSDNDIGAEIAKIQVNGAKDFADIAPIKRRYSTEVGSSYWSNGCKWCGEIVGEHFLENESICHLYEDVHVINMPFTLSETESDDYPHWCLNLGDGFCETNDNGGINGLHKESFNDSKCKSCIDVDRCKLEEDGFIELCPH